jgi:serine/threonine-protein kinase
VSDVKPLFRAGDLLNGVYEVRSMLGHGGMGQVFEGYDRLLRRSVAIKASLPTLSSSFLRDEAQALAAFNHPSVVTIHSMGSHWGIDYIVMERLYGTSMLSHLYRRAKAKDPMGIEEATDVLIALTDGLAVLHRSGLAHRDLKPANIMLAPGNRVVLMDFGLVLPEAERNAPKDPAGTPQYMAPETVQGTAEPGDRKLVDLYALGAIAYEMLTGSVPFPADDPEVAMLRQIKDPTPDARVIRQEIPPRMGMLISALLAKSPADRPQSAESVAWVLRQIRAHTQAVADVPLSVLIVDDDTHASRLLDLYVREVAPDALIRTASDGESGLVAARERVPDLLLLDLQMPGMNGVELAMYLRATHLFDQCRIVALSGRAQEHDLRLLRDLGITDFIPKDAGTRQKLGEVVRDVALKRAHASFV